MLKFTHKLAALSTVTVLGVVGGGTALLLPDHATATEETPLVQQVEAQQKTLENHETRISDTESAVQTFSANGSANEPIDGGTSAIVPTPDASPAPVSAPQERRITAYKQVDQSNGTVDCLVSYSDGSSELMPWRFTNPQGAWMVDGTHPEGYWIASTTTNGQCD